MIDFSSWTDDEINEAIFRSKGWQKLPPPAIPAWQRPTGNRVEGWYFPFPPDYTHDWRMTGELLEELPNCELKRWGGRWLCVIYDDNGYLLGGVVLMDSPQRAICEAWLEWRKRENEYRTYV